MNDLVFQPEDDGVSNAAQEKKPWKILIVDDEPEVHSATKLVLDDFAFEGAKLAFFSAYSGKEALELMQIHEDIAVVLLDVVMETQHDGLECARSIRKDLKNRLVRIILRTGQPGQAPEHKVIVEYDINDYKQKTDLTAQRLFTTIYTAIRSYRDILAIERNRIGLKYIIEASGDLFRQQSLRKLAKGVLTQISALFRLKDSLYMRSQGFTLAQAPEGSPELIAATGKYTDLEEEGCVLPPEVAEQISQVITNHKSAYFDNNFVGYFPTQDQRQHILYMEDCGADMDKEYEDLLNIFTQNVGVAFDNRYLNQELQETQQEIIHLLGEIVESRSKETAYHVIRVAEYIGIIGRAAGYDHKEVELIQKASPMHDIGKIAIPDAILLKSGKLDRHEMDIMRTHTHIGSKILSSSKRPLLKMASVIARTHHERWDGSGYPKGLKGVEIPLAGRLTCIADTFDALVSERIYKKAWPLDEVFQYLKEERGKTFDPYITDVAISAREEMVAVRNRYIDVPADPDRTISAQK